MDGIWCSVMESQHLIRSGLRVRVGSGSMVKIWGDPWLVNSDNPYIVSDCSDTMAAATVNYLINPVTKQWDPGIVNHLFIERDRECIFSLPLPYAAKVDKFIWAWNSKGVFSVRSGYLKLLSYIVTVASPLVTSWQSIWQLKIPPKVKNFIWRALSGCFPTKVALISRRVEVGLECPLCQINYEDEFHALVSCPQVRRIWALFDWGDRVGNCVSLVQWWNDCRTLRSNDTIEKIYVLLWILWKRRNLLVWENKVMDPLRVVHEAKEVLVQWKAVNSAADIRPKNLTSAVHTWQRPPLNWYKLNVDASVFSQQKRCGYGGVLRDAAGSFIAALQGTFWGNFSPLLAEAMAMREVLSWLKNEGCSNVIMESDSQVVVKAIQDDTIDESSVGLVLDDCRTLCQDISSCKVEFIRRSANNVAHKLARAAYSMSGREVWVMSPPPFILDALMED